MIALEIFAITVVRESCNSVWLNNSAKNYCADNNKVKLFIRRVEMPLWLTVCFHRMDTTLVNFNEMKWERGDITFLFIGERKQKHSLYILDNKFRVFQKLRYQVIVCIHDLI